MNSWHHPALDPIMWLISFPPFWIPVYVAFLVAAYRRYNKKGILFILVGIGLVVLLADNIHRELFKEVFQRLRPSRNSSLEEMIHLVVPPWQEEFYKGGKYGFISGHASNFTGIAVFVARFLNLNKNWSLAVFFWALLICFSRIYLGVHYPGDIAGGIILGVLTGTFVSFIANKYFPIQKTI